MSKNVNIDESLKKLEAVAVASARGLMDDVKDLPNQAVEGSRERLTELSEMAIKARLQVLKATTDDEYLYYMRKAKLAQTEARLIIVDQALILQIQARERFMKRLSMFGDAALKIGEEFLKATGKVALSGLTSSLTASVPGAAAVARFL